MANVMDVMRAYGVRNPEVTAEACRRSGLDPAAGMVKVMMETSGGAAPGTPMIWGHDRVDPQGAYRKGGPVTRSNVEAYMRGPMRNGNRQGCGDAQLTSAEYQDRGEALGGMHLPLPNQQAGAVGLARLQAAHGIRGGFRRYNGSGPRAEEYARKAMLGFERARAMLAGVTTSGSRPAATTEVWGNGLRNHAGTRRVQAALRIQVDGDFGDQTERAVRAFQRSRGLLVDGRVGPATRKALGI